ncbi:hypothetical protein MSG28_014417 [Choristoneura fumiferana]|uniref:Uncharacterized protein n=1 Tax=Choristoneura fumiferana TaxID=7141 RepID=A0ACC0JRD5_CHOFU|nr:hypothetical protein MSG28_014417 [Choristoneura fumiferana]
MALGDENAQEKGYGEDIHSDITKRMDGILMKGLPKEQKEIITKNLLIPANMMLLEAPKLNNELNAILSSSTKTRDKLLEGRQQDLGLAGASVLYAIHKLSRGEDKIDIIKSLGDASRLLCNLHYEYTNMRKKLISPHLDKSLSLNLKENTRHLHRVQKTGTNPLDAQCRAHRRGVQLEGDTTSLSSATSPAPPRGARDAGYRRQRAEAVPNTHRGTHKDHRKYLRFMFNDSLYEFNCLPFGLATAPYAFTKLLKPVMEFLREQGIRTSHPMHAKLILGACILSGRRLAEG